MAEFNYAELASIASELLAEFGQNVVLTRVSAPGVYDPATGVTTGETTTSITLKGAMFNFGRNQTTERNALIQVGDRRLLLEAGSSAPQLTDAVLVDGVTYGIVSIGKVNPAGTPVTYSLHLRP